MNTLSKTNANYESARSEVCGHIHVATTSLASGINYFQNNFDNHSDETQVLVKLIEAYSHRSTFLSYLNQGAAYSLARLEADTNIHENLGRYFEKLAPEMEKAIRRAGTQSDMRELISMKAEIANNQAEVYEFNNKYTAEIAAEKATPAYHSQKEFILAAINDLQSAVNGTWQADTVEVKDYMGTGKSKILETPDSLKLSEISSLTRAGQLRLPPVFLTLERK